jgi:hypothetical protein
MSVVRLPSHYFLSKSSKYLLVDWFGEEVSQLAVCIDRVDGDLSSFHIVTKVM